MVNERDCLSRKSGGGGGGGWGGGGGGGGGGKLLEMARRIYGLGQVSSSEMVSV